jgi:hypothetical protein
MAHATPQLQLDSHTFRLDAALWTRVRNSLAFIALVSWLAVAVGWIVQPDKFYPSYLVGFLMAVSIPLGALFFVMVQYLTGSAWSVPMRRIAETLAVSIPICGILFIPVAFGIPTLYSWSHPEVARELGDKTKWLNENAFVFRAAVYFIIWSVWSLVIYSHSTRQDNDRSLSHMHSISRWSAPGLLVLMVTASLAAIDWIMSLNPKWYSTMWGIYFMSGAALAFMAVWTLICLAFRRKGILTSEIRLEHYHDFGKWLFALTCFWAYISFSQYMLIWYGNLPEETIWFKVRTEGFWLAIFVLLVWGHFLAPFVLLISRNAKRSYKLLGALSVWLLFMEMVDLYFIVIPSFRRGFPPHWLDLACVAATLSALGLFFWSRLREHSLIPVGDPRLLQGLEFENV